MDQKSMKVYIWFFTVLLVNLSVMCIGTDVDSGETITLSATASDEDCHFETGKCPHKNEDEVTVTWSAVFEGTSNPAGTFPSGNTGTSVQWTAPYVYNNTNVTITATATDSGTKGNDGSASDTTTVTVVPDPDGCCAECQSGDPSPPGMSCINGRWNCVYGMCLDGECEDIDVFVDPMPYGFKQVVNCDVTFTAETMLSGYESHITWSGGGTPATGTGASFTTRWATPGTKTVTATISSCDGKSTWDSESVDIIQYTPIEDEYDFDRCQDPTATLGYTPTPNGCGSSGGVDVPENPARECPDLSWACIGDNVDCVNTSFTPPCNLHDECYGTCEEEKGSGQKTTCDAQFGARMHTVCNNLTGSEFTSCYDDCDWWASTYSLAVALVGGSAYKSGQIEACSCADCEYQ